LLVLRSELNLTPGQKAQIHGVLLNHRNEIVTTMQAVHAKRSALGEAILQGKSEGEIRAAAAELGDVIADTAVRAARLRDEIAPVLTDEQQQLILQFVKDKDNSVERFLEHAASGQ
jgi:Spy/CpxP family protein refolding chaperone